MNKVAYIVVGVVLFSLVALYINSISDSGSAFDKAVIVQPILNITYLNISNETDPVAVPMFANYYNQSSINTLLTDIQDANVTNDITIESTKNITTTKYIKPTQGAEFTNGSTTWRVIVNGTGCFRVEQVI